MKWSPSRCVNIRMDVPPAGESYTAYLHIPGYIFEFTTSKDAPPPSDVGTLDFGTKIVNYSGTAVSNWVSFQRTTSGEGNSTYEVG